MTGADLLALLKDPKILESVRDALGLPDDPVSQALKALAEAQARTEATMDRLGERMDGLADVQGRTDAALERLTEAQARTDAALERLTERVDRLTERMDQLTERVDRLAEAQIRTDASVRDLRVAVGRLSDNVGFGLEELAAIVLPAKLEHDARTVLTSEFRREWVQTAAGEEEVDLWAEGDRDGAAVTIVGEVKSRIYAQDVKRFEKKAERVEATLSTPSVRVLFGFVVHPSARELAAQVNVHVIASRPG